MPRAGIVVAIAGRELRGLFLSPLAWTVLAVAQAVLGYVFLIQIDVFFEWQPRLPGVPGAPGITAIVVAPLLKIAGLVLLLLAPLVTMRLVAEERRSGTLTLLLCAPVSMAEIVLGKFAGAMGFFAVLIAVVALMPLSLLLGGSLDWGLAAAGFLGLALLAGALTAAGLFMSTLTAQPAVAAIAAFGLGFGLWILAWAGDAGASEGGAGGVGALLAWLSVTPHFDALLRGVFDTGDVAYYVLFTALFLVLAVRRLDAARAP